MGPSPDATDTHESQKKYPDWLITTMALGIVGLILVLIYVTFSLSLGRTQEYSPANFEAELEKNRAKWYAAQLTHYKMIVDFSGYGSYDQMPWTLDIQNEHVASAINVQGNSVLVNDSVRHFTVTALFADIEDRYQLKAPSIHVSYNPAYGYPENISINPWSEPCCQEYDVEIRGFQVLP